MLLFLNKLIILSILKKYIYMPYIYMGSLSDKFVIFNLKLKKQKQTKKNMESLGDRAKF